MKRILQLATLITLLFIRLTAHAVMLNEDKLGKEYWTSLDAKSQTTFLTGFRHAIGPLLRVRGAGTNWCDLVLHGTQFPKVIEAVDAFYSDRANEYVPIIHAIEVCLMKVPRTPQADIDAVLQRGRSLRYTAF